MTLNATVALTATTATSSAYLVTKRTPFCISATAVTKKIGFAVKEPRERNSASIRSRFEGNKESKIRSLG